MLVSPNIAERSANVSSSVSGFAAYQNRHSACGCGAGIDVAARAFNVRFPQQQLSAATKRKMFSTLMVPSLSPFDYIGPAGSLYGVVSGIVNR